MQKGYDVTPIDVKNLNLFDGISPLIYDGKKLPFDDDSFDVVLLIAVLHHSFNPIEMLKEARRVSKRLIIMEGIYNNKIQKYVMLAIDGLGAYEFGRPYTFNSLRGWELIFKNLGFKMLDRDIHNFWKLFTGATFHLEKIN